MVYIKFKIIELSENKKALQNIGNYIQSNVLLLIISYHQHIQYIHQNLHHQV